MIMTIQGQMCVCVGVGLSKTILKNLPAGLLWWEESPEVHSPGEQWCRYDSCLQAEAWEEWAWKSVITVWPIFMLRRQAGRRGHISDRLPGLAGQGGRW